MAKLSSAAAAVAALGVCALFALLAGQGQLAAAGYTYTYTTGGVYVEGTVKRMVKEAIRYKPSLGPALIRLLFHDCWVYGCDASVLLDKTPYNSTKGVEKKADSNIGLDGFDLIDQIKAAVGENVSCADILAYAARDAAYILSGGNISYAVTGGRKDGVYSSAKDADMLLPGSNFSYAQLVQNFDGRNFSAEELVVLSGAHAVGVCHKSSFKDRLLPSVSALGQINLAYQAALTFDVAAKSGSTYDANPTEMNNIRDMYPFFRTFSGYNATGVNTLATNTLDNSYYTANLQNMVLLKSDWELTQNSSAKGKLEEYKNNGTDWNIDFSNALAKLSNLTDTTPAGQYHYQEIRKNCRIINNYY